MMEEYAIIQDYYKVLIYVHDQQINNVVLHIVEEIEIIPENIEMPF